MKHYLAVNQYRSSTSDGFANTWGFIRVPSRAEQSRILREGLPVSDAWILHEDGSRTPQLSTNGIRTLLPSERAQIQRGIFEPESL